MQAASHASGCAIINATEHSNPALVTRMKHVLDMMALLRTQPISGLEPELMGLIDGFGAGVADWLPYEPASIWLLEPPAGRRELYLDPVMALSVIHRHLGQPAHAARVRAVSECERLYAGIPAAETVRFYNYLTPDSPLCIPAPALTDFLRQAKGPASSLSTVIDRAIDAVRSGVRFTTLDQHEAAWTLDSLPALPPPPAMIEFVSAAGWEYQGDLEHNTRSFNAWRNRMRPIAARLAQTLGEPVYRFADPGLDTGDDNMHRFLLLHWLCSFLPASPYVRFLVEASGAAHVEALKSALLDPASYTHPFKMHDAFYSLTARTMRVELPGPGADMRIIAQPSPRGASGRPD